MANASTTEYSFTLSFNCLNSLMRDLAIMSVSHNCIAHWGFSSTAYRSDASLPMYLEIF